MTIVQSVVYLMMYVNICLLLILGVNCLYPEVSYRTMVKLVLLSPFVLFVDVFLKLIGVLLCRFDDDEESIYSRWFDEKIEEDKEFIAW